MSWTSPTTAVSTVVVHRGVTVEPVNGHLKDRHQLRQFSCRGIEAAQAEAELATATANLLKIWRSRS